MSTTAAATVGDLKDFYSRNRLDVQLGTVVAFSGGSDSLALLVLLANTLDAGRMVAVYVDHALRDEAELAYEREMNIANCHKLSVKLEIVSLGHSTVEKTAARRKGGIEEAARHLRRRALQDIAERYSFAYIATGHTADDQAETVLMRLLHGGGTAGPKGISAVTLPYIRPVLDRTKDELSAIVRAAGLQWSEDTSNADTRFERNAIRHRLIPVVKSIQPNYRSMFAAVAEQGLAMEAFLEQAIEEVATKIVTVEGHVVTIAVHEYRQMDVPVRHGLIYRAWNALGPATGRPQAQRFPHDSVCTTDEALMQDHGGMVHLDFCGCSLTIDGNKAFMTAQFQGRRLPFEIEAIEEQSVDIGTDPCSIVPLNRSMTLIRQPRGETVDPLVLQLDESLLVAPVTIRAASGDDRIALAEGTKRIADLYSAWKLPALQRAKVAVLEDALGIVAVFARHVGARDRLCRRMRTSGDLDRKCLTLYSVTVQKD